VKEIRGHIDEVQNAFIALLADSKSGHLARESCCLGLAACRGLAGFLTLADDKTESASLELNNKLLRAFGQTSNHGGSAMMETRAQADERRRANGGNNGQQAGTEGNLMESFGVGETEVGGTSGLGEAALGAYREMAAAAVSLGRPDVLYTLLILSASHSIWFTPGSRERYSASALLGKQSIVGSRTNSAEMREALRPHLGKLLPRMIRACHDPNRETRERMSNLWLGITGGGAEARQAISQHLLPTMDTLIEEAASKLWRARVGACGALSQIIVARSWRDLGGGSPVLDDDDVLDGAGTTAAGARLLRLWRSATRALDDVRGNVRESGEHLARTVRGLTIRLCDPSATDAPSGTVLTKEEQLNHERDASAAAATSLRWLIKHGLNQPCAEATGVCVSCLVGIVDVANPSILQPLIPALLRSLLFAMSGLEPAALSYLQVRAAGQDSNSGNYDRLERLRIQFAQSGPLATAVTKCLEMLPGVSLETQKAVIPHLDAALRLSAGFASRAATADAVSTLCSTCPNAFKFPGASSTNPSIRLLRALYFASERERGQAARDKMAHALGNIASLCPGGSVRSLALRACTRYNSSTGNNDDPAARRAAAVALRSMAVRASNQFSDGGNSDIWCRRVLPVAFLGMKDSDAKVASMWKEVWSEGGSTANLAGAAEDFGSLLEEKLLPHLVKECVKALEDVSWSRRVTGAVALGELADINILAPSPRSVSTVKTVLLADAERAKRRAQSSNTAILSLVKVVSAARLWTGKSEVVKATVKVASKWSSACSNGGDERELFGLGSENGSCPWKPIAVCPGEFENDLFVGDAWFIDDLEGLSDEDVQIDGRSGEVIEVDEGSDEVKMDFDECDKLLETENQASTIEDGGVEEEMSRIATFTGLCRILLNQGFPSSAKALLSVAEDEVLPYRAVALQAFKELVDSLGESSQSTSQKQMVFQLLSPKLISVFDTDQKFQLEKLSKEEPPLVVARAIDCLAACFWDGIGDATHDIPTANILKLTELLEACGGAGQGAWTVREAAAAGCESLARRSHSDGLINPHATFSTLVNCVSQAQKDRKFWRVRLAGLKLLRSMVRRAGNADNSITGILASTPQNKERQLLLEAMLPHKEKMFSIAKQGLTDAESQITALSTEILSSMSWWP
jgi:proteasome component ECM29